MRRAIGLAVVLGVCAVPARADVDGNVNVYWTQQPRLVAKIPLWAYITGPASLRATVLVSVDGRPLVTVVREGHTDAKGNWYPDVRLTEVQRRAIARAAERKGERPVVAATVDARYDATGMVESARGSARMRLAPFYDGTLRFPDAPKERSYAISVDLPGEWLQIHGAMAGTYSPGSFSRYVGGRAARCRLRLSVSAKTILRAPTPRPRAERGRAGVWRWWSDGKDAFAVRRAPADLPGTRPLVVVHASGFEPPACAARALRAALRRAVQTAVVRRAAPQAGPGFDTA
jgi:hypothetical protein